MEARSVRRVLVLGEGDDNGAPVCLGSTQRSTFPHMTSSESENISVKQKKK